MSKLGLIVEGGGMKCAYHAAILDRFLDDGITFDYCIGVSAGSANAASFLAGQRDRNKRFYIEHSQDPLYFGPQSFLTTGSLFNLQYIYGDLTNSDGKDPIDYQAIVDNPCEFKIVATNARTGKPRYFDKKHMMQDDYRVIMASCALPGACRPIKLGRDYYFDGGVSDSIPIRKAFQDGCDKVVVLLTKPRDFVKEPEGLRLFYKTLCHQFPKIIDDLDCRHIRYRQAQADTYQAEAEGRAFVFAPSESLPMSTYSMDVEANEKLYDLGLKDYEDLKEKLADWMK